VACLLRLADYSHLDDSRAPSRERIARKVSGESGDHWIFQGNLNQPIIDAHRLSYTSKRPLGPNEMAAWWLCYDTLRGLDAELRAVGALLADTVRPPLQVNAVANIESPDRFAKKVAVEGWHPVDAQIRVGNVAQLVRSLGGHNLYGNNQFVPLREMVQNGADAIRARRLLDPGNDTFLQRVIMRIGRDSSETWVEFEDDGVGMSSQVLTGPFLDFGSSFWGSSLMRHELSGLEAKGFLSTGRFGIGFFSIFMWGDRVQVFTRPYTKGRDATKVLEFPHGTAKRPILKKAEPSDWLSSSSTRIRVWLRDATVLKALLTSTVGALTIEHKDLNEFLQRLCLSLDVDLWLEDTRLRDHAPVQVVRANDWIDIEPYELMTRLGALGKEKDDPKWEALIRQIAGNLRPVRNEQGEVIARIALCPKSYRKSETPSEFGLQPRDVRLGFITVGGFVADSPTGIAGVLMGSPNRATRDQATPIATRNDLALWATEQAGLVPAYAPQGNRDPRVAYAANVIRCGGSPGSGWLFESGGY